MVNKVSRSDTGRSMHFLLLLINILNVMIHSLGGYTLCIVYANSSEQRVQQIFLINLSVTECLTNLLEIVRIIPDLVVSEEEFADWQEITDNILIVSFSGFYFILYADMIYITLDRLLDIVLNIKYAVYVSEQRAKYLLIVTWLLALGICVGEMIYYHYYKFSWEDIFFIYFYPPIQFVFIILATATYGFIFRSYKHTRRPPVSISGRTIQRQSSIQIFRYSRFYISVLLILTFIIFMILPDLTYIFMAKVYDNHSDTLVTGCLICYSCSNLADGVIYIFMQRKIRRTLWKKFPCCKTRNAIEPGSNILSFSLSRFSISNNLPRLSMSKNLPRLSISNKPNSVHVLSPKGEENPRANSSSAYPENSSIFYISTNSESNSVCSKLSVVKETGTPELIEMFTTISEENNKGVKI